jgi:hypothetical protein
VEQNTRENGKMISNMVMVSRLGRMRQSTRDSTLMVRSRVKGYFCGKMIVVMMASLWITISMVLVNMCGGMGELMRVNGSVIRWMGKGCLLGWMGVSMRGSIRMIRRKDLVLLRLEMVGFMKGSGRMESSMVREYLRRKIWFVKVCGMRVKE